MVIRNFQDTLETRKWSFISAFLICITVPLKEYQIFLQANLDQDKDGPSKKDHYFHTIHQTLPLF